MSKYLISFLSFIVLMSAVNISFANSYKAKFWVYSDLIQIQLIDEDNGFVIYDIQTKDHKAISYETHLESKDQKLIASVYDSEILKNILLDLKIEDVIYMGLLGPREVDPLTAKEIAIFPKIQWSQTRYIMKLPSQVHADLYLTQILVDHLLSRKQFTYSPGICESYFNIDIKE